LARIIAVKNIFGITLWGVLLVMIFAIPFITYDVNKSVEAEFLNQHGDDRATLVYFGFSECDQVCPVALVTFKQLLDSYSQSQLRPAVIFVDIGIESNTRMANQYASSFHQQIIGYHASQEQLTVLSDSFGLNIKQYQGEIMHQGRTYLLRKDTGRWNIVKSFNPTALSLIELTKVI